MATEVRFEVEASRVDDHYGVTLFVHDSEEEPDEGDEVPVFFLVFRGPGDGDPTDAARHFGACHQEAMDTVGLQGQVTEEEFANKLEDSIELAGELMVRHGFQAMDADAVDQDLMTALFWDGDGPETDPSLLN